MGCKVCYFDPAPVGCGGGRHALDARAVSLDELLASCRRVTLHVPLMPETAEPDRRAGAGASMKKGAILIQASRGGVVDEAALAARLDRQAISAARRSTSIRPSRRRPTIRCSSSHGEAAQRLLLTPHIAGITRQSSAILFRSSWQNVERVLLRGEPPVSRVY